MVYRSIITHYVALRCIKSIWLVYVLVLHNLLFKASSVKVH